MAQGQSKKTTDEGGKERIAEEARTGTAKNSTEEKKKNAPAERRLPAVIILLVLAGIAIAAAYLIPNALSGVSFPTFKQNFDSAPRVAIAVTYYNNTQLNSETLCFTDIVEVISHTRDPSTIDFFALNSTNCTYAPNGLGHVLYPLSSTPAACVKAASSEPGIFLNYSDSNRTAITAYHMYIYANGKYLSKCPIAVDLS